MSERLASECVRDGVQSGRYLSGEYGDKAYFARPSYLPAVTKAGTGKRLANTQDHCNPPLPELPELSTARVHAAR